MVAEEAYYFDHGTYTTDLSALGLMSKLDRKEPQVWLRVYHAGGAGWIADARGGNGIAGSCVAFVGDLSNFASVPTTQGSTSSQRNRASSPAIPDGVGSTRAGNTSALGSFRSLVPPQSQFLPPAVAVPPHAVPQFRSRLRSRAGHGQGMGTADVAIAGQPSMKEHLPCLPTIGSTLGFLPLCCSRQRAVPTRPLPPQDSSDRSRRDRRTRGCRARSECAVLESPWVVTSGCTSRAVPRTFVDHRVRARHRPGRARHRPGRPADSRPLHRQHHRPLQPPAIRGGLPVGGTGDRVRSRWKLRPFMVSSTTPWPLVTNCTPSLMGPAVQWLTRRPWPSGVGSASTGGTGRFADARGGARAQGSANLVAGKSVYRTLGVIGY